MSPDVLIVGAGPAGMSAAISLAYSGARVRVVDEQLAPGGQVYRALDRVSTAYPDALQILGKEYADGAVLSDAFKTASVEFSASTSVWDITGGKRPTVGLVKDERAEMLHPTHIILAGGAMERPTPFPGWTLPGVMGVGAAQTLLKESGLVPKGKVIIAGTGPLVYLYARQMIAAGAPPTVIVDSAPARVPAALWGLLLKAGLADFGPLNKGRSWLKHIRAAGVDHLNGVTEWKAIGDQSVKGIEYRRRVGTRRLECDLLLVHDGVIPNTHLSMVAECSHRWHPLQRYWAPTVNAAGASSQPGISIAGDGAGIEGADAAACRGRIVGFSVACHLGLIGREELKSKIADDQRKLNKLAILRSFLDHFYRPLPSMQVPPAADTIVCRCEEVTAGEILKVAKSGCVGPNQGKAFTRCGMGPCMGRYCGTTVSQIIADHHGLSVEDVGHYRIRPPVRPLRVGQLAALD
ncbi:MAG: NAD(P)/FAD-dependent oxidoreductase [Gammaproteobacteria bacterium]|nr:NAD(P)/FAD-dependent oxidoreductase [Gammaproteobacteria bacterium]